MVVFPFFLFSFSLFWEVPSLAHFDVDNELLMGE